MNKAIIMGRIGSKDLHEFENGKILNLSVATDESYFDKNKEQKVEKTEWHKVVFRNRAAENVNKYFEKGDKILLEGKLSSNQYEDKDGIKRKVTEISAFRFEFVESKKQSGIKDKSSTDNTANRFNQHEDDLPF